MALTYSERSELGSEAPEFSLPGTDGKTYQLSDFRFSRALVVIFMCNHCPYVQAIQGRLQALAKEYRSRDVQLVGINSNDSSRYPDDSFEAMSRIAKDFQNEGYAFPYLWDESQEVAKAYGAVCTPDFFVYENSKPGASQPRFVLRYRGRLDDQWKDEKAVTRRDLALALDTILAGKQVLPEQQISSMGCSIKWK